jgi:hypothetical protein
MPKLCFQMPELCFQMPELCFQMQNSPKLREKLSGGWDIYCIEERGIGSGVNFWTGENGGGGRGQNGQGERWKT